MYIMQDQCTALYVASQNGHSDVVKSLLDANAEADCVCKVSDVKHHIATCSDIHYQEFL